MAPTPLSHVPPSGTPHENKESKSEVEDETGAGKLNASRGSSDCDSEEQDNASRAAANIRHTNSSRDNQYSLSSSQDSDDDSSLDVFVVRRAATRRVTDSDDDDDDAPDSTERVEGKKSAKHQSPSSSSSKYPHDSSSSSSDDDERHESDDRFAMSVLRAQSPESAKSPSIDDSDSEEELTGYQTSSWGSEESEKDEPFTVKASGRKNGDDRGPRQEDINSRMADLESRKTEDGCLLPRGSPKKKEDGTFARPCGRAPPDKEWDPIRGLYAPKGEKKGASSKKRDGYGNKKTSKSSGRPAVAKSHSIDESDSEEEELLTGYQTSSTESEESEKGEPIATIGYDAAEKGKTSASDGRKVINSRMADLESRKTEDGCLLPRGSPKKKEDGTFARPCGRAPPDKEWDPIRGLYAPKGEKKGASSKKSDGPGRKNTSKSSRRPAVTTSADPSNRPARLHSTKETLKPQTDPTEHRSGRSSKGNGSTAIWKAGFEKRRTEDGCVRPPSYKNLRIADDGSFVQPPGRCPVGMVWDSSRGVFAPIRNKFDKSNQKRGSGGTVIKNGKRSGSEHSIRQERPKKRTKRNREGASESMGLSSKSTAARASEKQSDPGTEIGARVYAEWNNDEWFWGSIMDLQTSSNHANDRYLILFDDGDQLWTHRKKFRTARLMLAMLNERPPTLPEDRIKELRAYTKSHTFESASLSVVEEQRPPPGSLSLFELYVSRCKKCEHCKKPDCGACVSCLRNKSAVPGELEVCVQKMCLQIDDSKKKQVAVGLPPGWTFLFKEDTPRNGTKVPHVPGLVIHHPQGTRFFRSAEAACAFLPKSLELNPHAVSDFNRHIGVDKESIPCGVCENCRKDACRRCARCRASSRGASRQCFQKMCFEESIEAKAAPAEGFPPGWRFYFAEAKSWKSGSKHRQIPTLWVISPGSYTYRSAEAAIDHKELHDGERITREFYYHVGLSDGDEYRKRDRNPRLPTSPEQIDPESDDESSARFTSSRMDEDAPVGEITTTTDNFLVGRKCCFAWTDWKGQRKVLYGKITTCKYNVRSNTIVSCKVVYESDSRAMANGLKNECACVIPESQWLGSEVVVGGCMRYEEQNTSTMESLCDLFTHPPFGRKWIIPDMSREDCIEGEDGQLFPCLTLSVRGYHLVLSVKPSTIPNAGNGVFLSCKPAVGHEEGDDCEDEQEHFDLDAGELLDLGIYAPCRIQDKKPAAAFTVKNFVHSNKCEEFSFGPKDTGFQLDITDDTTGELHDIAKARIHPYVNERKDEDGICIWAEHDVEGAVHLLLGHAKETQKKFVVPADGSQVEVFMNYGVDYEKVRARKGYSFREHEEMEELNDADMLGVIYAFGPVEVEAASNFLFQLFSTQDPSRFTGSVIDRSLTCAAVLQRRAQVLLLDADNTVPCLVNLAKVLRLSKGLVTLILHFSNDEHDSLKTLNAAGNVDGLLREVLKRQYSDEQQLEMLKSMME